jgi:hypothetical protein
MGLRAVTACRKYGVKPWSLLKLRCTGPAGESFGKPTEPRRVHCWLSPEKRVVLEAVSSELSSVEYSNAKGISLSFREKTLVAIV